MLNIVTIEGRITRDVEMRVTQSGKHCVSFSLASERDVKASDGTRETDFIDCVAFGGNADFLKNYVKKGNLLIATGRLQSRKWTDKDGKNRISFEVVANNVYSCERKESSNANSFEAPVDDFTADVPDADLLPF